MEDIQGLKQKMQFFFEIETFITISIKSNLYYRITDHTLESVAPWHPEFATFIIIPFPCLDGISRKYLLVGHHGRKFYLHPSDEEAFKVEIHKSVSSKPLAVPIFGAD